MNQIAYTTILIGFVALLVVFITLVAFAFWPRKKGTTHNVDWTPSRNGKKLNGKCRKNRCRRQSRQRPFNGAWRQK